MDDYCTCKDRTCVTSELTDFGYWDVCVTCGKRIIGGYHYYDEPTEEED